MGKAILIIIGIIGLVIFLVEVIALAANHQFTKMVDREIQSFSQAVKDDRQVVEEADLVGLPAIVQTWLEKAQVLGKEKIVFARTEQEVQMRLEKDQPWMPTQVVQYIRTEEPGFIWKAKIKPAPFFHIVGRDKYVDGHGNMLIKIMSLLTVADGRGPEIDQGSLLRYLGETIWVPTAALSDYITWEPLDAISAKATMEYKGVKASGVFTFNSKGEPVKFEAKRYREIKGAYQLDTWVAEVADYKEFDGFVIPSLGKLTWQLENGDFEWYRLEVKAMEYN